MEKNIYGRGAAILTDGNSLEVKTGAWKNKEPIHLKDKCKNCMFCVSYCPEGCIYQKDGQSNLFYFQIQQKLKEVNRVPKITRDMEKAGPITPIPNPKWNVTTQGSICKHSICLDTLE